MLPVNPKLRRRFLSARPLHAALVLAALLAALPGAASAQPFGAWLTLVGAPSHGFVQVPHSLALNPTNALTIEAWISVTTAPSPENCRSIIGKNWLQSYWLGVCSGVLRSYLKGSTSVRNGGVIPSNQWTHVAVVFTGAERRHYINGELINSFPEAAPLPTSGDPVRIGSDVSWQFTPQGAIDEVRLWNVARTTAQIRSAINVAITAPQPGLVAVWSLDGNGNNALGPHDGVVMGAGTGFLTFPVALNCGTNTATSLCLLDRFTVRARFRTGAPGTAEGTGQTVNVVNDGSGLFWFFSPDNWEVMVKAINACGLNNRYWVFSAATTNVFYRLEVTDVRGAQKIFFNYPGPPAPAVTDTGAFATCP